MNLFQPIYSSSLIYPKDEEKRRNICYLCLLKDLKKFMTRLCMAVQGSAPHCSPKLCRHARSLPSSNAHQRRCQRLTKEEGDGKGTANLGSPPCRAAQVKNGEWYPSTSPSAPRPPPARVPGTSTEPRPAQPRGSSRVPSQTCLTLSGNLHFGSPPNAT